MRDIHFCLAPLTFTMLSISLRDYLEVAHVLRSTLLASLFGAGIALMVVGFKLADARPHEKATAPTH